MAAAAVAEQAENGEHSERVWSMKSGMRWLLVLVVVAVVIGIPLVGLYNRLVGMDVELKTAWAQVENQLQRRSDLIPNLMASVKGYAAHEQTIFTNVANARAKLAGASTIADKVGAANELESALARLLVLVENYPQLKADVNFRQLMDELAGTENRIAVERMRYNERVRDYNGAIRRFPAVLAADMLGFREALFFNAPAETETAPVVAF